MEQDDARERFIDRDLTAASFERVNLRDAVFRDVDLRGVQIRGALMVGAKLRGVVLADAEIHGAFENLMVNGVEVGPYVQQQLDLRYPRSRHDATDGARGLPCGVGAARGAVAGHARSGAIAAGRTVAHLGRRGVVASCRRCVTSRSRQRPGCTVACWASRHRGTRSICRGTRRRRCRASRATARHAPSLAEVAALRERRTAVRAVVPRHGHRRSSAGRPRHPRTPSGFPPTGFRGLRLPARHPRRGVGAPALRRAGSGRARRGALTPR